ncbi:MAG TPA: hypothetical protein VIF12_00610 [Micavibrio sp.]
MIGKTLEEKIRAVVLQEKQDQDSYRNLEKREEALHSELKIVQEKMKSHSHLVSPVWKLLNNFIEDVEKELFGEEKKQ